MLLAEASAATRQARDALDAARHAEMAHALRGSLRAGSPCPVCMQPVTALPRTAAAPKAVAAAEKALAKHEAHEADVRSDRQERAAAVGAAATSVSEAETRAAQAAERVETTSAELRTAEAELTAIKDQLTERLGDGEPQALVMALEAELAAAESAAARATEEVEAARRDTGPRARASAKEQGATLANLASALAGVWGALGTPRSWNPIPTPCELPSSTRG